MSMNFIGLCRWVAVVALMIMIAGPISQPVYAADEQKMAAPFSWDGVYAGLHVGYGWGNADTDVTPLPTAAQFGSLAQGNAESQFGGEVWWCTGRI